MAELKRKLTHISSTTLHTNFRKFPGTLLLTKNTVFRQGYSLGRSCRGKQNPRTSTTPVSACLNHTFRDPSLTEKDAMSFQNPRMSTTAASTRLNQIFRDPSLECVHKLSLRFNSATHPLRDLEIYIQYLSRKMSNKNRL